MKTIDLLNCPQVRFYKKTNCFVIDYDDVSKIEKYESNFSYIDGKIQYSLRFSLNYREVKLHLTETKENNGEIYAHKYEISNDSEKRSIVVVYKKDHMYFVPRYAGYHKKIFKVGDWCDMNYFRDKYYQLAYLCLKIVYTDINDAILYFGIYRIKNNKPEWDGIIRIEAEKLLQNSDYHFRSSEKHHTGFTIEDLYKNISEKHNIKAGDRLVYTNQRIIYNNLNLEVLDNLKDQHVLITKAYELNGFWVYRVCVFDHIEEKIDVHTLRLPIPLSPKMFNLKKMGETTKEIEKIERELLIKNL